MARARTIAALGLWTVASCQSLPTPTPSLISIVPTVIAPPNTPSLMLQGDFPLTAQISFVPGDSSAIHSQFGVQIGATPLGSVTYLGAHALRATLPSTLPDGTFDVHVLSPDGAVTTLPGAVMVLASGGTDPNVVGDPNVDGPSPILPPLSAQIAVTPRAGDTSTVFSAEAVAADAHFSASQLQFIWDWQVGPDHLASGVTSTHQYNAPGTHVVTLTVIDPNGQRVDVSTSIIVAKPNDHLKVEDANDTVGGRGLTLRDALEQASHRRGRTLVTVPDLAVQLSAPLSIPNSAAGIALVADHLVLDGNAIPANHDAFCLNIDGSNNELAGVTLRGCRSAVRITGSANNLHDLTAQSSDFAVYVGGANNTFGPNNDIADSPGHAVAVDGPNRVWRNRIHGAGGAAVVLTQSAGGAQIIGNQLYHNTTAIAVASGIDGARIWFNTIDANGAGLAAGGARGISLCNNIFTHVATVIVDLADTAFSRCDGNDVFADLNPAFCVGVNMAVDPHYQAGLCGPYDLGSNSPLRGQGVQLTVSGDQNATATPGACGSF